MSTKRFFLTLLCPFLLIGQTKKDLFVNTIEIQGAKAVSKREIFSTLRTKEPNIFSRNIKFDRRKLRLDAISVKNLYLSKGYLGAVVNDSMFVQNGKVDVFLLITEGEQYFIREVRIEGNTILSDKKISDILSFKVGEAYNPVTANMNLPNLQDQYHRRGKLTAAFQISDAVSDSVDVLVLISEGPDVFIQSYSMEGLGDLDTAIVEREIMFKPGDLYNKDDIDLTQRYLLTAGVFSYAGISSVAIPHSDSLVHLIIEVHQYKPSVLNSEGGLYPIEYYEGAEPLPGFGAEVSWKNRSLWKTTTNFSTKLSIQGIPTDNYIYPKLSMLMGFANQWLFNRRLPTQLWVFYESFQNYGKKDDPIVQRYGLNFSTIKKYKEHSYLEFRLRWEKFIEPEGMRDDIQQRSLQITGRLDGTDDPLFPRKGVVLTVEGKNVGGILGGNRSFVKTDIGLNGYIPLLGDIVFAGRVKYGVIFGWDEADEAELYDKFYLGGSSSLRGWDMLRFRVDENGDPFGDVKRVMTNLELRFPLFWLLGGEVFIDGGQLSDIKTTISTTNIEWNIGCGLTLITPILPFRADIAFPLDKSPKDIDSWKIQLGAHYVF